ncbi:hypothetical protein ACFLY0_01625 [Patescibacteria group bacterium]
MKTYNLSTYIIPFIVFAFVATFSIAAIPAFADDDNDAVGVMTTSNIDDADADLGDVNAADDDAYNDAVDNATDYSANDGTDEEYVEDATDIEEGEDEGMGRGKGKEYKKRGDEHRSAVAELVKELKDTAEKAGVIGEEVRIVAQEQNDSKERIANSMEEIGKRGKLKTFLIGADYKNLGGLRSEIVTTENHINRLTRVLESVVVEELKTELGAEIEALNEVKANAEAFIEENEDKFSLFGWFVKLFN